MFCKHEWKVLSEVTTESKYELLTREGFYNLQTNGGTMLHLTTRKHILTVTCEKCGEIKQFVNEI